MNEDTTKDLLFTRIDALVEQFEHEGYPFAHIIDVMRDYIEIADDFLL
jgi:hypothetical protein